jgi:hypothetical protein
MPPSNFGGPRRRTHKFARWGRIAERGRVCSLAPRVQSDSLFARECCDGMRRSRPNLCAANPAAKCTAPAHPDSNIALARPFACESNDSLAPSAAVKYRSGNLHTRATGRPGSGALPVTRSCICGVRTGVGRRTTPAVGSAGNRSRCSRPHLQSTRAT